MLMDRSPEARADNDFAAGTKPWRSRVTPPPMIVLHRGWFSTTATEHPMEELARQDLERDQAHRAP